MPVLSGIYSVRLRNRSRNSSSPNSWKRIRPPQGAVNHVRLLTNLDPMINAQFDVRRRAGDAGAMLRIGIISDTHSLLRPEVEAPLAGVAHIIHAGDIGSPDIIAGLERIAPVSAIRGNVDTADWAQQYPETRTLTLGGRRIHLVHDIKTLQIDPVSRGIDIVVCGHSHTPRIETIGGVLHLNPGSAGPRRFKLPITLATLDLTTGCLAPVLHHLDGAS